MDAAFECCGDDEMEDPAVDGNYVLFHEDNADIFSINLFGVDLSLKQKPSARDLGIGAVVWESSAIFTKYMEANFKKFSPEKLAGRTVLELGSGCGLGGLAFVMRGAAVILTDLACVIDTLTRDNAAVRPDPAMSSPHLRFNMLPVFRPCTAVWLLSAQFL